MWFSTILQQDMSKETLERTPKQMQTIAQRYETKKEDLRFGGKKKNEDDKYIHEDLFYNCDGRPETSDHQLKQCLHCRSSVFYSNSSCKKGHWKAHKKARKNERD